MATRHATALSLFTAFTLLAPSPLLADDRSKTVTPAAVQPAPDPYREMMEEYIMAFAWFQTSGEARALYYQAFALADMMLEKDLANPAVTAKRAVIVDIDETILDNSPYNVLQATAARQSGAISWDDWVELAQAKALPGSVAFLNKADRLGVDIFYVSNRSVDQIDSTIRNLQAAGFPQATASHLLFSDGDGSKEARRRHIGQDHHIVLLMGDNLSDFAQVFEGRSRTDRSRAVDRFKEKFGKAFIVLPNPMYGEWESALYNFRQLTPEQKMEARRRALAGYPQ